MSLFSTIQQSANALHVSQLGLQVVGNNIANANTPGYIRQELLQSTAAPSKVGGLIRGNGAKADGVVQKIDQFVVERLRQTESALQSSDALNEIYNQLESLFGELTDNDLSSQLNDFSASINDVLNQPGNDSLRRLVIERGKTITGNIRNVSRQLSGITGNLNTEIQGVATELNRLTENLAKLNVRIVELEGGGAIASDAVGLRDERYQVLQEMSKLVDIRAVEQTSGSVTVFVGGEYLVSDGIQREVKYVASTGGDASFPEIRLADTDSPIRVTGGRLHGLYGARDGAITNAIDGLDGFANDLIEQFNLIHTQGQGTQGFQELTSDLSTDDPTAALDLAGYSVKVENGQFEIQVIDSATGTRNTIPIRVKLTGGTDDSSLNDISAAINAVSGLSSEVTPEGKLRIGSDTETLSFSFQNDSSNFLAAAGLNTFFTGNSAATIDVNSIVANDPTMFAASLTGIGNGTENAIRLAQAFDEPLSALGGKSIKQSYEDIVVETTQDINLQAGVSDGLRNFYRTLESQHLATSGVNLDEEAVKMIFYQRAFQANSRLIQASSEMLEVLVNL